MLASPTLARMLTSVSRVPLSPSWRRLSEDPELDEDQLSVRNFRLAAVMVLIVVAVGALAYWDAQRESAAALEQFAEEQSTLATALAAALRTRADAGAVDGASGERQLGATLAGVERPQQLVLLVRRERGPVLRRPNGLTVRSERVAAALDGGARVIRIPREEAAAFGLPARTALAGLARVDSPTLGSFDIVAMASAERERDRERWARSRLLLSVATAAGLVLAFGGLAMRNQRKELLLERELAIANLRQARDERLQRASRAASMGTLAMGVAHEISTPLGVIAARAEQALPRVKAAGDERLVGAITAILEQGDRIKLVIRGLLGLARGDAPLAERIDPDDVIRKAVELCEHRFAKAEVPLVCERAGAREGSDRLPAVHGEPRLLEHALVNLLLNACDACRPGDTVTVSAERDGGGVLIHVDDTGVGISPSDSERATEPFFTTKARGEGTGLGLAIVQEIVAHHRGTLALAPRQPRGTSAAIRLPGVEDRSPEQ
jgi:two-component system, NtrC family, sensor kinase